MPPICQPSEAGADSKIMMTTNPFDVSDFDDSGADDDKLREECGIFGVSDVEGAAAMVALGLHALQHRGQEAAGISSYDGFEFRTHRANGHVAGNFDREEVIGDGRANESPAARDLEGDASASSPRVPRGASAWQEGPQHRVPRAGGSLVVE